MGRKITRLQSYFVMSIKTGWLSLIRAILYSARTVPIKQTHVPAFLNLKSNFINNRLHFGGNFAAAHSDGILTSSVTTSTINKQDTTSSANQITGNSGSLETTCNAIFQIFCLKMRFELSYLFTDFFGPVESNIKEEQFTQIFEHLIGISQKPR